MKYSILQILCVFVFVTTSHGANPLEELQAAYPAVEKNGYAYIKMDHVRPGGSAATDVTTLRLSYRNGTDPQNDPLVVVNYSAEGYPKSAAQKSLLDRAVPAMGKRSSKPVVYIDVVALKKNAEGLMENVFMANLLEDLANNNLGLDQGKHILPYGNVWLDGDDIYDFSYSIFQDNEKDGVIQKAIAKGLLASVIRSNKIIAADIPPR